MIPDWLKARMERKPVPQQSDAEDKELLAKMKVKIFGVLPQDRHLSAMRNGNFRGNASRAGWWIKR